MKRIAVIGVLGLILAALAGPAFAQEEEGSVLPEPGLQQPLPSVPGGEDVTPAQPVQPAAQALADTGFEESPWAILGLGLLALGGAALLVGRRRATTKDAA